MLVNQPFYYKTLRNTTVAFGNLFNEIYIETEGKTIKVPLQYLSKEKFTQRNLYRPELDDQSVKVETTLPAMGFEMTQISYDAERKLNKLNRIQNEENSMLNRVPYKADFTLYIGTRKMDDSFRIIEQILPYFTPELIVKIKDKPDFNISTNIPFTLLSTDMEVISDGDFEERRSILWTLSFSCDIYFYPDTKNSSIIRKTDLTLQNDLVDEEPLETLLSELNPFNADEQGIYDIDQQILDPDAVPNELNIITRPDKLSITGNHVLFEGTFEE